MISCPKCGCEDMLYAHKSGYLACENCGQLTDTPITPYPGNATREQWVQEVAKDFYLRNADESISVPPDEIADDALHYAEAFVAACDKHFNR